VHAERGHCRAGVGSGTCSESGNGLSSLFRTTQAEVLAPFAPDWGGPPRPLLKRMEQTRAVVAVSHCIRRGLDLPLSLKQGWV
jgi:hypothetical protein